MGRKVFHVIHTRSFKSFPNKAPWQVLTALTCWLERYGFRCKIKTSHYASGMMKNEKWKKKMLVSFFNLYLTQTCVGKERGINVNNVAKFKLRVTETEHKGVVITFEHYASNFPPFSFLFLLLTCYRNESTNIFCCWGLDIGSIFNYIYWL